MGRLYLLGGEDVRMRTSRYIMQRAVSEAGESPTVLIFPWTSEADDGEGEMRALMTEYFMDLGAETVQFAETWDPYGALMKKARDSGLVYLPGGNPQLLVDRMLLSRGDEVLAGYDGIVVGHSAGALALCRKYAAVVGQNGTLETRFFKGFGHLDFAVSVHYMSDDPDLGGISPDSELEALSEKSATKIFAISDNSALIYDHGTLDFMGYVFQFHRGARTRCL